MSGVLRVALVRGFLPATWSARVRFVTGLVLVFLGCVLARADTNTGPGMLFLHCRIQGQAVTVLRTVHAPGVVKAPGVANGEIEYALLSAQGETLWRGVIEDPRVQRFDYEDPPRSGRLRLKVIRHEAAEFVVRVPARADARWIEFRKLDPAAADAATDASTRPRKTVLGRFALFQPPTPGQ